MTIRRVAVIATSALLVLGVLPQHRAGATFPGKNGRIAFNNDSTGNHDVYTMDHNGKDVRQLTTDPGADTFPNWSPDGAKIAFTSTRDGNREIYLMNADGSNQTRLTNDPAVDTRADWSPDGSKLVFVSTRDGDREVYVMDADGTNVSAPLTNNTALDSVPIYSPDGTKILFFRLQPATQYFAIFVMNADGTGEQQLTPDQLGAAEGDWSPDGSKIVFQDNTCALPECQVPSDIRVMDADGGNALRVTHFFENDGPLSASNPRWSPDGKRIGFIATPVGPPDFDCGLCRDDIHTIKEDGNALRQLTDSPVIDDFGTAWGPRV